MHTDIFILGREPLECNSGGPSSRQRNEIIGSTLLGTAKGRVGCPTVMSAALDFEAFDPLHTAHALLRSAGIEDPDELRERYLLPDEPCICHPTVSLNPLRVATAAVDDVLLQVALLGRCTSSHYDPRRPILLTRASLTRQVVLYSGREFYA